MLRKIELKAVGPAENLSIDFSPRINYLTGDNGLGKSFILDLAWWSLTRTWARGVAAFPRKNGESPEISVAFDAAAGIVERTSKYSFEDELWSSNRGRPPIPGIVIYAGVDGGFSVWDPSRNYWRESPVSDNVDMDYINSPPSKRPKLFDFTSDQLWNGLIGEDKITLCNGLIRDWVDWQTADNKEFYDLVNVLSSLSSNEKDDIRPGLSSRIDGGGTVRHPTILMPYGEEVPLVHASAGIKRIAALAYLLVWAWHEHKEFSSKRRVATAREIILLVDEIECHLHPQWQRKIIPAIYAVINSLTKGADIQLQLIAATHSPLVLASTESMFRSDMDSIWDFDLIRNEVVVEKLAHTRYGDVNSWLVSEVFNLSTPTSLPAETALNEALAILRKIRPTGPADSKIYLSPKQLVDIKNVSSSLSATMSQEDPFLLQWYAFVSRLEPQ